MSTDKVVDINEKKLRSMKEIQDEYASTCATIGEKTYHIEALKAEINVFMQKVQDLNKEAFEAKSKEHQAAKAEALKTVTPDAVLPAAVEGN